MKDKLRLRKIYERTDGYCHLCHRKLSFINHGRCGSKGAWHVEHSIPRSRGGGDHLNNLFAACIDCNLEKGVLHNSIIRRRNAVTRAPFNRYRKEEIREDNTLAGLIGGGMIGARFGPVGLILGAVLGGLIGEDLSPNT